MTLYFFDINENHQVIAKYSEQQYNNQPIANFPDINKSYKYIDNQIIEDTFEQFQKDIQYQHDVFSEYSREIVYQIQYNTALGNTALVINLQSQLQAEQQAVITRINAITEAYNENNQQST